MDTLKKASICPCLSKLHFKDRAIQKHGKDIDPGISMKLELLDLKKWQASDNQILKFKTDIVLFLSTLCANLAVKSLSKFPLTKN